MKSKYTYEDWLSGKVILKYAYTVFKENKVQNQIILVDKDDFLDDDFEIIKKKQIDIFESKVNTLKDEYVRNFKKAISSLQKKSEVQYYIQTEKEELRALLTDAVTGEPFYTTRHHNVTYDNTYLQNIRICADEFKKFRTYSNLLDIHSYEVSNNNDLLEPKVLAAVIIHYHEYLEKLNLNEILGVIKYLDTPWFKVAIAYANGKIDEIRANSPDSNTLDHSKAARILGDIKYRRYIQPTESIRPDCNYQISPVNIFYNKKRVAFLLDYCKDNQIQIVQSFYELLDCYDQYLERQRQKK